MFLIFAWKMTEKFVHVCVCVLTQADSCDLRGDAVLQEHKCRQAQA